MSKPRTLEVDRALDVVVQHLKGSLAPGKEFSGVISPTGDDVDVEITVRVTRRTSTTQTARYRARAMTLLAAEGWRDRCPVTVKNRGDFRVSKTTSCSGKVTAAIVYRSHEWEEGPVRPGENRRFIDGINIHFACVHHEQVNDPDVLAVVRLEKNALRDLRVARERSEAERVARARIKERELEAEVAAMPVDAVKARLNVAIAAHDWTAEEICAREIRRRTGQRLDVGQRSA